LATVIVDKHFKALSKKWYDDIIEVEGCDKEMLHEALSIIQRLNPKPGWGSGDESRGIHYIIPDFIVSREGGNLTFTLNERNNPQLHISGEYSEMMKQLAGRKSLTASERETLQFIKSKSESAQWLIETLQQRQQTLASTMTAILGMQRDYFLSGNPADLKPMRLKDIAAITGYDESTISRVANQKYVQSDFGTFLMKELFSKAVATEDGDVKALQHVKETLRAIIEEKTREDR
jgi:RNA polymerase sigma-54 factor